METVLDMQNHQTAILEDLKKAKDRQEIAEEIKGQMIAAREKRDKSMQTWLKFGIAIISLLLGWLTYRLESKGKNVSDLVHPEVSQGIHQSIAKD